jgi:hypothetical protein
MCLEMAVSPSATSDTPSQVHLTLIMVSATPITPVPGGSISLTEDMGVEGLPPYFEWPKVADAVIEAHPEHILASPVSMFLSTLALFGTSLHSEQYCE